MPTRKTSKRSTSRRKPAPKPTGRDEGGSLKMPLGSVNGVTIRDLCAWVPDENRQADFAAENGTVMQVASHLAATVKEDTYLWLPLVDSAMPSWVRGAQGIGDCVSWGAELAGTMLMGVQHVMGAARFIAPAATEPIYGGCRVEALGKRSGGYQDGAAGSWSAKWMRDWGLVLRLDMTDLAGNPEHDLRVYDKAKAKAWGNFGCGGQNDNAVLDGAARSMAIQQVAQVTTVAEAEAMLLNGYTITIASMAGFGRMERDNRGICRIVDKWPHQMMLGGVRFRAGAPEFRCFQSWGKSCSGPDPGIQHKVISDCSWWVTAEDLEWILRTGDCWGFSDVLGMPARTVDFARAASGWARTQARRQDHHYSIGV